MSTATKDRDGIRARVIFMSHAKSHSCEILASMIFYTECVARHVCQQSVGEEIGVGLSIFLASGRCNCGGSI